MRDHSPCVPLDQAPAQVRDRQGTLAQSVVSSALLMRRSRVRPPHVPQVFRASSNGRTTDSESVYEGSTPSARAERFIDKRLLFDNLKGRSARAIVMIACGQLLLFVKRNTGRAMWPSSHSGAAQWWCTRPLTARSKEPCGFDSYPLSRYGKLSFMKNGPYELVVAPDKYPGKRYRGRYIYEHHLVWWQKTGEIIEPGFLIHHKNDDKRDNRYSNLEKKCRGVHTSEHMLQDRPAKRRKLICPVCKKSFERFLRIIKSTLKTRTNATLFCGRSCAARAFGRGRPKKYLPTRKVHMLFCNQLCKGSRSLRRLRALRSRMHPANRPYSSNSRAAVS